MDRESTCFASGQRISTLERAPQRAPQRALELERALRLESPPQLERASSPAAPPRGRCPPRESKPVRLRAVYFPKQIPPLNANCTDGIPALTAMPAPPVPA